MVRRPAATLVAVVLLAGCTSTDLSLGADRLPSTTSTTTALPSTTTTTAPTTTSTTPPAPTLPGAVIYEDPGGRYDVEVAPEWPTEDVEVPEITAWIVSGAVDGFTPNMNVVTQPGVAGVTLEEFLVESARGPEQFLEEPEIIDQSIIAGAHGDLGRLEYRGRQQGFDLRFVQIIGLAGGTAAVVTFSVADAVADELVPRIEPYMRTIRIR